MGRLKAIEVQLELHFLTLGDFTYITLYSELCVKKDRTNVF